MRNKFTRTRVQKYQPLSKIQVVAAGLHFFAVDEKMMRNTKCLGDCWRRRLLCKVVLNCHRI